MPFCKDEHFICEKCGHHNPLETSGKTFSRLVFGLIGCFAAMGASEEEIERLFKELEPDELDRVRRAILNPQALAEIEAGATRAMQTIDAPKPEPD